ncbi:MAG: aminoacyl-tRNA hydrolase [Chloroflexi bacterium]|nr:aminoacyl-tRNA hydrolase [Chloroflexota bacterium]
MAEMRLIVGLGNPGAKYERTRHNVGWRVIDVLVTRYQLGAGRSERRAHTWDGSVRGQRVKLAKPLTYMNRSGECLRALMDYYEIPLDRLIVVHDDLDTPFGALRLRKAGGHGGQRGLRSIMQHLGGKEFARLRFGIGRPPGRMQPVDYVLRPFKGDDAIKAEELAARAADAIEAWLSDGIELAMSRFNGDAPSQREGRSKADLEAQLAICQRAHELAPSDPKALIKLIAIQKKLGLIDEALAGHLQLATMYDRQGESSRANAERVKAVTIQPGLVEVQRAVAEWYLSQDQNKRAVARYLILADYYRERDPAAALSAVERALAINPQHPKALAYQRSLQPQMETE